MATTDKTIGELPVASSLDDDSLLVVEQQSEARSIKGQLVKQFAKQSVSQYVTQAQQQAQAAANSATQAAQSATNAATSEVNAEKSAEDAAASAKTAQEYSGKPPIIQNDTWWTWDADEQKYVDTGESARGDVMYATFSIDPETGLLTMTIPDGYTGPTFAIVNGFLEVSINA